MRKVVLLAALVLSLFSTSPTFSTPDSQTITFPKIDRHPPAISWNRGTLREMPAYDPDQPGTWAQVDLRSYDLSALNLTDRMFDLLYASFDSQTIWPPADQLPPDFDWQYIMELGKNPGLNVRQLHAAGITGQGVGIAIIDQTLLVDHQEYVNQLRLYEELENVTGGWRQVSMHGPAVASIAVGQTVGVAPGADLYYIASAYESDQTFYYLAQGVRRILEINEQLPPDRKIRVISMSIGWSEQYPGYDEISAAVAEAQAAGIFVVSSSLEEYAGLKFNGLGRPPLTDPDDMDSYEMGLFWSANPLLAIGRLMIPMDSRATASPTGIADYAFYRDGGWSWSIPYIAGLYALAAQVDPTITPERFWEAALETAGETSILVNGQDVTLGPMVNPPALIAALQP